MLDYHGDAVIERVKLSADICAPLPGMFVSGLALTSKKAAYAACFTTSEISGGREIAQGPVTASSRKSAGDASFQKLIMFSNTTSPVTIQ